MRATTSKLLSSADKQASSAWSSSAQLQPSFRDQIDLLSSKAENTEIDRQARQRFLTVIHGGHEPDPGGFFICQNYSARSLSPCVELHANAIHAPFIQPSEPAPCQSKLERTRRQRGRTYQTSPLQVVEVIAAQAKCVGWLGSNVHWQ